MHVHSFKKLHEIKEKNQLGFSTDVEILKINLHYTEKNV